MARTLGLLRQDLEIQAADSSKEDFGMAYCRRENVASETHGSQRAIQDLCKELAQASGFQLFVDSFSSKKNNGGNAKYICKKLNGQQYFDKTTPYDELQCPFSINVRGTDGSWKVTRINFSHNHVSRVGFSEQPLAEGNLPRSAKAKRNTTHDVSALEHLIEAEMLPRYDGKTDKMTGAAISRFIVGKGYKVDPSVISRIKTSIDERLSGDMIDSYQKLESYLKLVADKNPGSIMKFEKRSDGTFHRACFIPRVGVRVAKASRRLYGFDGTHLKGEMNQRGVFLVGTSKDFNSSILPFAFSLVPVENKDNWIWVLEAVKEAMGDIEVFTVLSDRDKGLQAGVTTVFPLAGHLYCLRHIKGNLKYQEKISLTKKERAIISRMANSDCENDYKLLEAELKVTKPEAAVYLAAIDQKHWVKYVYQDHFKLPTYRETTSNLAEQSNNWIGNDCRSAKPLDAFGLFFRELSELVSTKRQYAARFPVCPRCSRGYKRWLRLGYSVRQQDNVDRPFHGNLQHAVQTMAN